LNPEVQKFYLKYCFRVVLFDQPTNRPTDQPTNSPTDLPTSKMSKPFYQLSEINPQTIVLAPPKLFASKNPYMQLIYKAPMIINGVETMVESPQFELPEILCTSMKASDSAQNPNDVTKWQAYCQINEDYVANWFLTLEATCRAQVEKYRQEGKLPDLGQGWENSKKYYRRPVFRGKDGVDDPSAKWCVGLKLTRASFWIRQGAEYKKLSIQELKGKQFRAVPVVQLWYFFVSAYQRHQIEAVQFQITGFGSNNVPYNLVGAADKEEEMKAAYDTFHTIKEQEEKAAKDANPNGLRQMTQGGGMTLTPQPPINMAAFGLPPGGQPQYQQPFQQQGPPQYQPQPSFQPPFQTQNGSQPQPYPSIPPPSATNNPDQLRQMMTNGFQPPFQQQGQPQYQPQGGPQPFPAQ
jgi:hypothetical protein